MNAPNLGNPRRPVSRRPGVATFGLAVTVIIAGLAVATAPARAMPDAVGDSTSFSGSGIHAYAVTERDSMRSLMEGRFAPYEFATNASPNPLVTIPGVKETGDAGQAYKTLATTDAPATMGDILSTAGTHGAIGETEFEPDAAHAGGAFNSVGAIGTSLDYPSRPAGNELEPILMRVWSNARSGVFSVTEAASSGLEPGSIFLLIIGFSALLVGQFHRRRRKALG